MAAGTGTGTHAREQLRLLNTERRDFLLAPDSWRLGRVFEYDEEMAAFRATAADVGTLRYHAMVNRFLEPPAAPRSDVLGSFRTRAKSYYPGFRHTSLLLFYDGAADEYGVLMCGDGALKRWTPSRGKTTVRVEGVESWRPIAMVSVWGSTSCVVRNDGGFVYVELPGHGAAADAATATAMDIAGLDAPVLISHTTAIYYVNPRRRGTTGAGFWRWRAATATSTALDVALPETGAGVCLDFRALSDHSVLASVRNEPRQYLVQFDSDGGNPRLLRTFSLWNRHSSVDHVFFRPNAHELVCARGDADGRDDRVIVECVTGLPARGVVAGDPRDALHNVVLLQNGKTYTMVRVNAGTGPAVTGARSRSRSRRR
jgi:hypothetical protein